MVSRYDMMTESGVYDVDDLESYPDPLSIRWNDFSLTSAPYLRRIEERHINRPWLLTYEYYNRTELDDVLLSLNNVPYKGMLEPGDSIYLPEIADIESFMSKSIKDTL